MRYLIGYGATALAFIALDAAWLTFVGPKLYKPVLGDMMTGQVRMAPAILFYVVYVAGIVFLAERQAANVGQAALNGAVLGLVAYGTYAFTCHAILKNWSWTITLTDIPWGIVATAAGAAAGFWAMGRFAK
jgi:uncharacterized membrane protein